METWALVIAISVTCICDSTFAATIVVSRITGEISGQSKLRCSVIPNTHTMQSVHWFKRSGDTVYYDAPRNITVKTKRGPGNKYMSRNVKGKFSPAVDYHELIIPASLSTDEGQYFCEAKLNGISSPLTGEINFNPVAMPDALPKVLDQSGNVVDTSNCTNKNSIPSAKVSNNASFLCRVGGSKPYPKIEWSCTGHCKIYHQGNPIKTKYASRGTIVEKVERRIDVSAGNGTLTCTVVIPDPRSGQTMSSSLCFKPIMDAIVKAPDLGYSSSDTSSVDLRVAIPVPLLVIFCIAVIGIFAFYKRERSKDDKTKTQSALDETEAQTLISGQGLNTSATSDHPAEDTTGQARTETADESISRITELEKQLAELKQTNDALKREQEETLENKMLSEENANLKAQLQCKIQELRRQKSEEEKVVPKLRQENIMLKNELEDKKKEIQRQKTMEDKVQQNHKEEVEKLEEEILKLKSENEKLQKDIQEMKIEMEQNKVENKLAQERNDRRLKELEEAQKDSQERFTKLEQDHKAHVQDHVTQGLNRMLSTLDKSEIARTPSTDTQPTTTHAAAEIPPEPDKDISLASHNIGQEPQEKKEESTNEMSGNETFEENDSGEPTNVERKIESDPAAINIKGIQVT